MLYVAYTLTTTSPTEPLLVPFDQFEVVEGPREILKDIVAEQF